MRRLAIPVIVALSVGLGMVLSTFLVMAPQPGSYLARPVVAVSAAAAVIGALAATFGRASNVVALFVMAWLVRPQSSVAVATAALLGLVIVWRLWRGKTLDVQKPILAGAVVFLLAGVVPVLPMVSGSSPTAVAEPDNQTPAFAILLDGYPRVDTLSSAGVDVTDFVSALRDRGFDYYPTATSHHTTTWRTLTVVLSGQPIPNGAMENKLAARSHWELPVGFVAIAPPMGHLNIPGVQTLNPGGPSVFEAALMQNSALGSWSGDFVFDGMRAQLDRALHLLAKTRETHIFAHLLAPHMPFLYAGDEPTPAPACWPACNPFERDIPDWGERIDGYLEWLNPRVIETIDGLLANHPDAQIVIFSDHGGRYEPDPTEWHRVFLASRTPGQPGVFAESPHPRSVLAAFE